MLTRVWYNTAIVRTGNAKNGGKFMKNIMSREQWGVCVSCFVAYVSAYLIRLNMSAALPALTESFSLTQAQSGMLQTVFAITYAAGQLVNGAIADKVSARRYVSFGLIMSAVCNFLFSFAGAYWQMVALWCLNGVFQSMLWTPIVKQVAAWFEGDLRRKVTFAISLTIVLGHLGAWAITGFLCEWIGWRLSFRFPALFALCIAIVIYFINHDKAVQSTEKTEKVAAPLSDLLKTGLVAMLLCCIANGFVRDGVVTWAPTIINTYSTTLSPTAVTLLIPALNCIGVLFGKLCLTRLKDRTRIAIAGMTIVSALAAAVLCVTGISRIMLCAVLLGVLCALLFGVNPLITSLFPMEYDRMGRVALVAGVIDCFIYIGSALAGSLTGALTDTLGWNAVFGIWAAVTLFGGCLAFVSHLRGKGLSEN